LNANTALIESVSFGAALVRGSKKPVEQAGGVQGKCWPQVGRDWGRVE
jgi:hypothetical protein